jgi:uncharacterized membrane protein
MHLLVPLAALLGIEVDALTDRLRRSAAGLLAMGLLAIIALTFLLIAANTALGQAVGPIWAPLTLAGGALLILLVIYVWSKVVEGGRKAREAERRRSSETSAFVTTAALTALPMMLKSPAIRNIAIPVAALAALTLFLRSGPDDKGKS